MTPIFNKDQMLAELQKTLAWARKIEDVEMAKEALSELRALRGTMAPQSAKAQVIKLQPRVKGE